MIVDNYHLFYYNIIKYSGGINMFFITLHNLVGEQVHINVAQIRFIKNDGDKTYVELGENSFWVRESFNEVLEKLK